jgi:hypothetical protein
MNLIITAAADRGMSLEETAEMLDRLGAPLRITK